MGTWCINFSNSTVPTQAFLCAPNEASVDKCSILSRMRFKKLPIRLEVWSQRKSYRDKDGWNVSCTVQDSNIIVMDIGWMDRTIG